MILKFSKINLVYFLSVLRFSHITVRNRISFSQLINISYFNEVKENVGYVYFFTTISHLHFDIPPHLYTDWTFILCCIPTFETSNESIGFFFWYTLWISFETFLFFSFLFFFFICREYLEIVTSASCSTNCSIYNWLLLLLNLPI